MEMINFEKDLLERKFLKVFPYKIRVKNNFVS